MAKLDDHIAEHSLNPDWLAAYEHARTHYRNGDLSDFVCPGGDQCSLDETTGKEPGE